MIFEKWFGGGSDNSVDDKKEDGLGRAPLESVGRPSSQESPETIKEAIAAATSFEELRMALAQISGIEGSTRFNSSLDLIDLVTRVESWAKAGRIPEVREALGDITRSLGLRAKVQQLAESLITAKALPYMQEAAVAQDRIALLKERLKQLKVEFQDPNKSIPEAQEIDEQIIKLTAELAALENETYEARS